MYKQKRKNNGGNGSNKKGLDDRYEAKILGSVAQLGNHMTAYMHQLRLKK